MVTNQAILTETLLAQSIIDIQNDINLTPEKRTEATELLIKTLEGQMEIQESNSTLAKFKRVSNQALKLTLTTFGQLTSATKREVLPKVLELSKQTAISATKAYQNNSPEIQQAVAKNGSKIVKKGILAAMLIGGVYGSYEVYANIVVNNWSQCVESSFAEIYAKSFTSTDSVQEVCPRPLVINLEKRVQ